MIFRTEFSVWAFLNSTLKGGRGWAHLLSLKCEYENTVLTAFREVEEALVEITTYRKELAAISRQQKAAKNANRLSKERYDKGVSSYLEVLDTERTLFSSELQQSELQQQYVNSYVNLYKSLGGGWVM